MKTYKFVKAETNSVARIEIPYEIFDKCNSDVLQNELNAILIKYDLKCEVIKLSILITFGILNENLKAYIVVKHLDDTLKNIYEINDKDNIIITVSKDVKYEIKEVN